MPLDRAHIRRLLDTDKLSDVFIELGWDYCQERTQHISVNHQSYMLAPVAQKRSFLVYLCTPTTVESIPEKSIRKSIDHAITAIHHEHIIIFTNAEQDPYIWQWVEKRPGKLPRSREFVSYKGRKNEHIIQKLEVLTFDLSEEEQLGGITEVASRAYQAFNVERITQQFYQRFQTEHQTFLSFIQGITSVVDREWYASLMLNRLMFVYFIQKKGFLDNNIHYLREKLQMMQEHIGKDKFLTFYRHFLLRLFHEGLNKQKQERAPDLDMLLGDVPFLNGGLFEVHELERGNENLHIPDEAFARIFAFFDAYHWHIDEQPLLHDSEINPDVIGYIFEKYINQKQMGAYYTREDITQYISIHTIVPYIVCTVQNHYPPASAHDSLIWQLLQNNPDRYISMSVRSDQLLPRETPYEQQARGIRYETLKTTLAAGKIISIHDCITYNLNSHCLIQDVIEHCTDPILLHQIYDVISHMTILDPTCGSGAFLFAALTILEPLYAACLERIQYLLYNERYALQDGQQETYKYFRETLDRVNEHPNQAYFILKTITINNLYGVDIMPEAVEICKLRLFLKLAAQLKDRREIEPLPDIDFNIRPGNTLIGFTHYADVEKTVLGDRQQKMDFANAMQDIAQAAQRIEDNRAHFRTIQTQPGDRPGDYEVRKQTQREQLHELALVLHRYLASVYGIDRYHMTDEQQLASAFQQWRFTHQPFHWFIEFYDIMQRGGFDVIIGNPPYIEYSKIRQTYTIRGYQTENCGNLYAAVLERALSLCHSGSYFGLIVPLSICGGERFGQLRKTLRANIMQCWLANFEIFPCRLFSGAYQRLSIFLAQQAHTQQNEIYVTKIQRWYAEERPHLINLISYTRTNRILHEGVFPKLASPLQENILHKVLTRSRGKRLFHVLYPRKTEHFVYYQEATNYWTKATCRIPYYKKNGEIKAPEHGRFLYFRDSTTAQAVMAVLNSSLFYVWFATFSDGFHLAHGLVKDFPISMELYQSSRLQQLAVHLEQDIQCHARKNTRNTKAEAGKHGHMIELEEYRMSRSKRIIDEIDTLLAQHYGLTSDELDFIINFDIKYRMGKDEENEV